MLTPSINDPNRESELKRRKKEPESFGTKHVRKYPDDWTPSQLKQAEKARAEEDAKERARPSRGH